MQSRTWIEHCIMAVPPIYLHPWRWELEYYLINSLHPGSYMRLLNMSAFISPESAAITQSLAQGNAHDFIREDIFAVVNGIL